MLFAACHVLRRLLKPRHPPCALTNFFSVSTYYLMINNKLFSFFNGSRHLVFTFIVFLLLFLPISQRTLNLSIRCGDSRSRTDDPLLAKQVL